MLRYRVIASVVMLMAMVAVRPADAQDVTSVADPGAVCVEEGGARDVSLEKRGVPQGPFRVGAV